MNLTFIEPPLFYLKAAIQKSGALAFTTATQDALKLNNKMSLSIAINDDYNENMNLYVIFNDSHKPGAYRCRKSGQYINCNAKYLFDKLNVDYKNKTIIYDIEKLEKKHGDNPLYLFKYREVQKRKIKDSEK